MCGREPEAAAAGADRSLPIAHRGSQGADGGFARRAQGDARRREDPACWLIECGARTDRARAQDCADRDGAEPIQRREPEMGERAEVLRERGAWFYAVVTGWRRQIPEGRCDESGGEGAERERVSGS